MNSLSLLGFLRVVRVLLCARVNACSWERGEVCVCVCVDREREREREREGVCVCVFDG